MKKIMKDKVNNNLLYIVAGAISFIIICISVFIFFSSNNTKNIELNGVNSNKLALINNDEKGEVKQASVRN